MREDAVFDLGEEEVQALTRAGHEVERRPAHHTDALPLALLVFPERPLPGIGVEGEDVEVMAAVAESQGAVFEHALATAGHGIPEGAHHEDPHGETPRMRPGSTG